MNCVYHSLVGVLVTALDSGLISVTSSAMFTLFPLLILLLEVGGMENLRLSRLLASFTKSRGGRLRELARLLRRPS